QPKSDGFWLRRRHARMAGLWSEAAAPFGRQSRVRTRALLKLLSGDRSSLSGRARRARSYVLLSYHGLIHSRHTKCIVLSSTNGSVDRSDGERAAPKDSFVYPTQEFLRSFEKSSTGSLCQ